jgi:hypothetical protein
VKQGDRVERHQQRIDILNRTAHVRIMVEVFKLVNDFTDLQTLKILKVSETFLVEDWFRFLLGRISVVLNLTFA